METPPLFPPDNDFFLLGLAVYEVTLDFPSVSPSRLIVDGGRSSHKKDRGVFLVDLDPLTLSLACLKNF